VLPHEQTFPKHKEDRMRILEATRSHLECIFGLFDDPKSDVLHAICEAPSVESILASSDDGVTHYLEPINEPDAIREIESLMADKTVWIADGHHRYETALAYRQNLGEREGPVPEDYMMMALCSISDPGLVLLPTHRILKSLSFGQEEVLERLAKVFDLRETASASLMEDIEEGASKGQRALGIVFKGGVSYVLTERESSGLRGLINTNDSNLLKDLDVTVLHQVILEELLKIKGLDQISYTRDAAEAVLAVENGAAVSFLMNPPTVQDMKSIALAGEKMPQKSTYYYPKILSGLVLWSLNDF